MDTEPADFTEAIALFIKGFRTKHNITQPQLQRRAREHYGATWSRGTVSGFEAGRGSMAIPTLLVLAASLSDLSGEALSLADLVPDLAEVEITPVLSISGVVLKDLLGSTPVNIRSGPGIHRESSVEEIVEKITSDSRHDPKFSDAQEAVSANAAVRRWSESLAIERAAKRLNIPVRTFQLWSLKLWGQPLDDEVHQRVSPDASAQKRGHLTRQLVKEIDDAIGPRYG